MPRTDLSSIQNCLVRQRRKLNTELDGIVKMKCTQSAYANMNRQEKRATEYHHDRTTEEKSLQRDLKKAERMADRIAQILEHLRKDVNGIKNFIGNYNFTNTVGADSTASGDCSEDLSQDISTREAWKAELCNMICNMANYVDQQYLGDYTMLHTPVSATQQSSCNGAAVTTCCPLAYRATFHYVTPVGDCLTLPSEILPSASGGDNETGNTGGGGASDNKRAPKTHSHNVVSNPNLKIRALRQRLCPVDAQEESDAWLRYFVDIVAAAVPAPANAGEISTALTAAFPNSLAPVLAVLNNTDQFGTAYLGEFTGGATTATAIYNALKTDIDAGDTHQGWWEVGSTATNNVMGLVGVKAIEDEPDIVNYVRDAFVCLMDEIRGHQIKNDREKATIEYVRDVSECNQAFHEEAFGEMTFIDEGELCKRYEVGKAMLSDLDSLYRENCVTKQSFFKDVTLDGCCSW